MERNREERRGFRVTQVLLHDVSECMARVLITEMCEYLLYLSIMLL
jgi:hypothetical protein